MLRQLEHLHLAFPHRLRILIIPCAILTSLAEALTSLAKALTFLAKSPTSSLAEILHYELNVKKILESSAYTSYACSFFITVYFS